MSNKPYQVGITGGIGSGKSLVCKIFSCLGIPIYDADTRAKWLMKYDSQLRNRIIETFGFQSYENNELNRAYLAQAVFNDQKKLALLNELVHPAVGHDYQAWVSKQNASYIIKEAALMFESGSNQLLNSIINVSAPVGLRIKRVLERDTFRDRKQIESIISKQISEEERIKRADFVIYNDDSMMLIPQVLKLHNYFNGMPSSQ